MKIHLSIQSHVSLTIKKANKDNLRSIKGTTRGDLFRTEEKYSKKEAVLLYYCYIISFISSYLNFSYAFLLL